MAFFANALFQSLRIVGVLLFIGLITMGCGSSSSESSSGSQGVGTLEVEITDAPYPFDLIDRADVTVGEIIIRKQGSGFSFVSRTPQQFNLLDLRGGLTELLASVELEAGTYDHLRVHIDESSLTLTDGRVIDFTLPSGALTSLKIFFTPPIEIRAGSTETLILDFDVSRSFVLTGNPQVANDITEVLFKPVIRPGLRAHHATVSGRVLSDACTPDDPTDDLPLDKATLTLSRNGVETVVNATNSSGDFKIYGVHEGAYDLVATKSEHGIQTIRNASFEKGKIAEVGVITLPAICGHI